MAVAAFRKIWDFLTGDESELEEEDEILENAYDVNDEDEEIDSGSERKVGFWNKNKVVPMPQAQAVRMVIMQPTDFEQSEEICDLLKRKRSIIINLEYVNKDVARRIIDTVSGAVTALDGRIEKVSNSIFVVAPYNYDIVNEPITREKSERTQAPWMK